MDYASLTVHDPSRLKRWVHRKRFSHSLLPIAGWDHGSPLRVLDVGAGDGRFCLHLANCLPQAQIVCFEPAELLREQAEKNLASHVAVSLRDTTAKMGMTLRPGEAAQPGSSLCFRVAERDSYMPDHTNPTRQRGNGPSIPSLARRVSTTSQPQIEIVGEWRDLADRQFDLIFCLEVLEHLPGKEIRDLVQRVAAAAAPECRLVFSVPNELYLAALAKGLFRAARRYGSFDAAPGRIWQATLGRPPLRRPLARLGPGNRYYFHHLGFDHRRLERLLARRFVIESRYGSPFVTLPLDCNAELFFVCRKLPG